MQLGEQQLGQGNIHAAIQMYEKAASLDPNNRAIDYFLGELYIQDKQFEIGIQHLRQMESPGWEYAPAEAALGAALYLQGDQAADPMERALLYVQAEEHLLRALEVDAAMLNLQGVSVQELLGGLYKRQKRIAKAVECYEEARKITPQSADIIVQLALLYFMAGNVKEAHHYFEQVETQTAAALVQNPRSEQAQIDHFIAVLALGNGRAAAADLELISKQAQVDSTLPSILERLQRFKDAPQPPDAIDQYINRIQQMIAAAIPGGAMAAQPVASP